jgi:hypothetical protein
VIFLYLFRFGSRHCLGLFEIPLWYWQQFILQKCGPADYWVIFSRAENDSDMLVKTKRLGHPEIYQHSHCYARET